VRIRRVALLATLLVASVAVASESRAATAAPPGLSIFQFVNSGTGVLPWNASSLERSLNGVRMVGSPHAASGVAGGVLAYRTTASDVATYTLSGAGAGQWADLSPGIDAEPPASDPIPFFDPSGAVDVLYVSATGHLIMLSANDALNALWLHTHQNREWHPIVATDLTAMTGFSASPGVASIQVSGQGATLTFRTPTNTVVALALGWGLGQPVPFLAGPAVDVTTLTATGAAASDPVVLPVGEPAFVTTSSTGDLELYSAASVDGAWSMLDLTTTSAVPPVAGPLTASTNGTTVFVAGLNASGSVELASTPLFTFPVTPTTLPGATTSSAPSAVAPPSISWTSLNVTAAAPGAPPLSGPLFLSATPSQVTIAGAAANWGDLFALASPNGFSPWTATDVSVTAGSAARTVAGAVAGIQLGTSLTLYAAGVASPPPQGVGVYAIPSAKWTRAVTDGWPILSETGGLGTRTSPWVGFTSAQGVATSPDFLMGQAIYNAHKRVTWLSFWTVSGPLANETRAATTYYSHGYAAGAWVATQIDQYRGLGVGLKPDWVIFDPEGYPDNHSALDAPAGASAATMRLYATYWTAMLQGWVQGIASVDPSLHAAVYANQSEYRNYSLASQPLPVFEALAFGGGGPVPVAGANGSNIRGYIAFSAVCNPVSSLLSEIQTLTSPPWSGQFNTLQFNAGVYCPPAQP
jgi:hypothetical protein